MEMTLETIYYIGQTASAVAIMGSLIFVGIQVRLGHLQTEQANKLAGAEMTQSTLMKTSEFQSSWYETEESADFMARALYTDAPLSIAQKNRLGIRLAALFTAMEVGYMLYRQGLYDQQAHDTGRVIVRVYCEMPRVQKWWRNAGRNVFIMPFQGVIDEMVKRSETANDAVVELDAQTSEPDQ
jgi:hypothetical protein